MNTITIHVSNNILDFSMEFDRRLNFIKGDSGSGKTTFYELVGAYLDEEPSVKLDSTYPIRLLTLNELNLIKSMDNCILLVDDRHIVEKKDFSEIVKDYCVNNNLWFIIMSREDENIVNAFRLSYSSNNIFKLVSLNNKYHLEPLYNIGSCIDDNHDIVITEDSKAGYKFFNKLFKTITVISANSKSNIVKCTKQVIKDGYKNVLVIFDTAAYGCHMEQFYMTFKDLDINISFISKYECFEELLVRLNINKNNRVIQDELENLTDYANRYVSWENYFEDLITRATKNKMYSHSHSSNLKDCYTESCKLCNQYKRDKCDYYSEDKLHDLLIGTKYEFLIQYI